MGRIHYVINDDLHRRAKEVAARRGITLKRLIEESLRVNTQDTISTRQREEGAARASEMATLRRSGSTLAEVARSFRKSTTAVSADLVRYGYDTYGHAPGTTRRCDLCGVVYEPYEMDPPRSWPQRFCSTDHWRQAEQASARDSLQRSRAKRKLAQT